MSVDSGVRIKRRKKSINELQQTLKKVPEVITKAHSCGDIIKNNQDSALVTFDQLLHWVASTGTTKRLHVEADIKVPSYLLPALEISEALDGDEEDPGKAFNESTQVWRSEYKAKLTRAINVHYIKRLSTVLERSDIFFRKRSSNWRSVRYYTQFKCSCAEGKLNFVYNATLCELSVLLIHEPHTAAGTGVASVPKKPHSQTKLQSNETDAAAQSHRRLASKLDSFHRELCSP